MHTTVAGRDQLGNLRQTGSAADSFLLADNGSLHQDGDLLASSTLSRVTSSLTGVSTGPGGSALARLAGVEGFKKFLQGTTGERVWSLWLDIERAKVVSDSTDLAK